MLRWLTGAKAWPEAAPARPAGKAGAVAAVGPLLWVAVFGIVMVAGLVLLVLLRRRF